MFKINFSVFVILGVLILGCGKDKNLKTSSDFVIGKHAFLPSMQGERQVYRALNALPDKEKNKIDVEFKMENDGQISFIFFADDTFSKGLSFNFSRKNDKNSFEVTLQGAASWVSLTERFSKKVTTSTIRLTIEIHNDEVPAHIIVKQNNVTLFNSEAPKEKNEIAFKSPGNGKANFWGFSTIGKASVQNIYALESSDAP